MSTKRIRVLHVDDDPDARRLLSALLAGDAELEEVGSRSDAEKLEEVVRETVPDVLLIDLSMRGRDPVEAIHGVRAAYPGLRIVVFSGSSDSALLERARKAGASQLARKAIDIEETLAIIRGDSVAEWPWSPRSGDARRW